MEFTSNVVNILEYKNKKTEPGEIDTTKVCKGIMRYDTKCKLFGMGYFFQFENGEVRYGLTGEYAKNKKSAQAPFEEMGLILFEQKIIIAHPAIYKSGCNPD